MACRRSRSPAQRPFLTIPAGAGQRRAGAARIFEESLTNSIAFSRHGAWECVGISSAPSCSVALGVLAGCSGGFFAPSASHGGTRPRCNALLAAPSRKAPASSASRRSTAPACAGPIFRSRWRRWARAARSAIRDERASAGRDPERVAQPRWPVDAQPAPARSRPTVRVSLIAAGRGELARSAAARRTTIASPTAPRHGEPSRSSNVREPPPGTLRHLAGTVRAPPRDRCAEPRRTAAVARRRSQSRATVRRSRCRPSRGRAAGASRSRRSRTATARAAAARSRARAAASPARSHAGGGQPGGDARLSDRVGARPLDRRFGAAGGDALVRPAGGRDQADLRLFLPRHERQSARAHFRARLRQCARHRRLHARGRPQDHGEGRLARPAGGAGLPARRAGRGLRAVHHRAGAGLERLSLRPHPRRSDARRERLPRLQSARGVRRGGGGARESAGRGTRRRRAGRGRPARSTQRRAARRAGRGAIPTRRGASGRCRWRSRATTARTTEPSNLRNGSIRQTTGRRSCVAPRLMVACCNRRRLRQRAAGLRHHAASSNRRRPNTNIRPGPNRPSRERHMRLSRFRPLFAVLALAASVALVASDSRRASAFELRQPRLADLLGAAVDRDRAEAARPMERSMTQPGQPGSTASRTRDRRPVRRAAASSAGRASSAACSPASSAPACSACCSATASPAARRHASMLGLLLQIGIIALIGYLVWTGGSAAASRRWPAARCCATTAGNDSGPADGLRRLGGGFGSASAAGAARRRHRRGRPDARRLQHASSSCSARSRPPTARKTSSALRTRVTPEMLSYYSEELAREREPRRRQPDLRRQAAAGRPRRSLARRRHRLRHRGDALLAQRHDRRSASGRVLEGGAGRGHRSVDLPARRAAASGCSRRSSRADADAKPQICNAMAGQSRPAIRLRTMQPAVRYRRRLGVHTRRRSASG